MSQVLAIILVGLTGYASSTLNNFEIVRLILHSPRHRERLTQAVFRLDPEICTPDIVSAPGTSVLDPVAVLLLIQLRSSLLVYLRLDDNRFLICMSFASTKILMGQPNFANLLHFTRSGYPLFLSQ